MLHKSILLYLLASAVIVASGEGRECSRELSRKVNSFLKDDLFPRMKIAAVDLPEGCPLNPALNMYKTHEESKVELNRGDWQVSSKPCFYYTSNCASAHYAGNDSSMSFTLIDTWIECTKIQ